MKIVAEIFKTLFCDIAELIDPVITALCIGSCIAVIPIFLQAIAKLFGAM